MDKVETFTILRDTFGKKGSEEQVEGLTLIIDGKLKEVFDIIISKSDNYDSYTDVLTNALAYGLNDIRSEINNL